MIAGGAATYGAYLFLPAEVFGVERWIVLVVIFLIVGTIVHVLFHFVEDVLTIARMVLDWKPVMVLVGLVSIAEGVMLYLDKSLISFF